MKIENSDETRDTLRKQKWCFEQCTWDSLQGIQGSALKRLRSKTMLEETHNIPEKEQSPSTQTAGDVDGLLMSSAGGLGTDFMAEKTTGLNVIKCT